MVSIPWPGDFPAAKSRGKNDGIQKISPWFSCFLVTIRGSRFAWNPYVDGFIIGAVIGSFRAPGNLLGSIVILFATVMKTKGTGLGAVNGFDA